MIKKIMILFLIKKVLILTISTFIFNYAVAFLDSNNFLKSKNATNTPKATNNTATINCNPDVKKSIVPVVIHAVTML